MLHSRTTRVLFVGVPLIATAVLTAFTGWELWPLWQDYRDVQALVVALRTGEFSRFQDALDARMKVDGGAAAVPGMIEALHDEPTRVRKEAADALERIGPKAKAAVPALIRTLDDVEWEVRKAATGALEQIGAAAKPAVPSLMALLSDKHVYVHWTAGASLARIGLDAESAVPALCELIDRQDRGADQAAYLLGQLGPQAQTAVSSLLAALKHKNKAVRYQADSALKKIDPAAAEAAR